MDYYYSFKILTDAYCFLLSDGGSYVILPEAHMTSSVQYTLKRNIYFDLRLSTTSAEDDNTFVELRNRESSV